MHLQAHLAVLSLALAFSVSSSLPSSPAVKTQQGWVQGITVTDEVNAFLGIPYAQPPVGPLRFQPPQPLKSGPNDNQVLNASVYGPVCHQYHYRTVAGYSLIPRTPESEDCLTLNIFVPHSRGNGKLRPVFVWSYGGAFGEGGGSIPAYDPTSFVETNKDIIFVSWNYRLNLFGFPNSPALTAQNLGLRDQRMALEWLRSNIASFGGDPNHMIMGGQSAGGGSTHSMDYAYPNDPIIKGQILQSGTVQIIGAQTEDVDSEFVRVATTVGCINANRTAELECMMTIDAEQLKHAISNRTFNFFGTSAGGNAMVDNVTMFSIDDYIAMGASGQFAKLPTLMGTMAQEGDGILNWSPTQGVNRTFSDIVTTTLFDCNIALEATFRATNNVPIWRYHYNGIFPSVTPYPWLRAYHGADIAMVFGTYDIFSNVTHAPPQYEVTASTFLQRVFGAFIRDPTDGLAKEFGWPMFNPNGTTLIELFQNNTPTASLTNPSIYDTVCANPPPVPWDELCPSTWPECNPA